MNVRILLEAGECKPKRSRIWIIPPRTGKATAMPHDIDQPAVVWLTLLTLKEVAPSKRSVTFAKINHALAESKHLTVFLREAPIKPADFVVLAIRVIVATLGTSHLVASADHRNSQRHHHDGDEVFDLSPAQILDLLIIRRTFDAAVPAQVVIRTIPISFAVRFVVLTVVGNEVVEGKAVMAGNEVDAVDRQMAAALIDVGAPGDARCYRAHKSGIAFHKAPNIIAVPPVPFRPAITRKVTDLVCARCVPGFSDYLGVRQHVGQLDRPDYGRIGHERTGLISPENR